MQPWGLRSTHAALGTTARTWEPLNHVAPRETGAGPAELGRVAGTASGDWHGPGALEERGGYSSGSLLDGSPAPSRHLSDTRPPAGPQQWYLAGYQRLLPSRGGQTRPKHGSRCTQSLHP